ncbi:MAG: NAD(P)-dependent oxidoreductase, partial [Mariprofundaceae bacterium]|nr:NAD(P)-dependent oxidoreductase [Mariprofundaceae bacterium]
VNQALLKNTPVRFAATATIGDDHYDKPWLDSEGINYANAAGSSTGSVIEYMLTALLELHARGQLNLPASHLGIIGAGRIGSALGDICEQLGIPVIRNDPPRARREGELGFHSLDELLLHADILTLHTPLHRTGEDSTLHLLNAERLQRFRGRGIINAGRGACLDNTALLEWLNGDAERFAILDCWENEPGVSPALLAHPQVIIATPHIAGHSLDGKAANTLYARRALCRWLGLPEAWEMQTLLPAPNHPMSIPCTVDAWQNLHVAATSMYDICADDAALRCAACDSPEDIAVNFSALRRHYPMRRSWEITPLHFIRPDPLTPRLARAMGILVVYDSAMDTTLIDNNNLVWMDLEMTGLNPESDTILEI